MVTQEEMTREQLAGMSYAERLAWWRRRYIGQGITWGMPSTLEWVREPEEDWDEAIAEVPSESPALNDERSKVLAGDWLEELDRRFPEDAEFFRKLEERFPDGYQWVHIIDPESKSGTEFFAKLKVEFPDAWDFFLGRVE